jgi:predicted nucleic acid-binding Zn ribbon protein
MPIASLASALQLSYRDTARTVHRLAHHGKVSYGEWQRHTGGRPARVVQLPAPPTALPDPVLALQSLCARWRGEGE